MLSDLQLIKLAKEGQAEAFKSLITKYKDKVFSMAYSYTADYAESSDIAQIVFLKVFANLKNFQEKEYEVELDRDISDEDIARLAGGIHLSELDIDTRPCNVRRIGKKSVNFVLTQGVNRQIRRMCYECGYKVKKLCRIRIMNLKLAELRPGEYRNISGDELKQLYESCGLSLR